jgi:hypothetical protein
MTLSDFVNQSVIIHEDKLGEHTFPDSVDRDLCQDKNNQTNKLEHAEEMFTSPIPLDTPPLPSTPETTNSRKYNISIP